MSEHETNTIVGCKFVRNDCGSLNDDYGRVIYTRRWQRVPGKGAYVAVTGGLWAGGFGPTLIYLECREPTGAVAPSGIVCFRYVRRVAACPDRLTPEMRGQVARYAPGLTPDQRMELAHESTPEWRGWLACCAPGLTPDQRMELVRADSRVETRPAEGSGD